MWVMWQEDDRGPWHVGFCFGPGMNRETVYLFRSQGEAADKVHYLNGGDKI